MEVEHELHAGVLDAASQHLDGVQILDNALSLVGSRSVGGIDKQAHAGGIPALLLGPCDDVIDNRTIHVVIVGIGNAVTQCHALVGLVLGQHRDVAAHNRPVINRILVQSQDDLDDGIHVSNIDFAVIVHISCQFVVGRQYHVDNGIHIGDVHLLVSVHVAIHCGIGTDSRQCQCQTYDT